MTKGPAWMPLDVADYLKDTSHLQAHEHGAYMLLIMRYWQNGGLPSDEALIRRYSLLTPEQWIESRTVLAALFNDGWRHKRIDAELAKAAEIIDKRRASAEQMHAGRKAKAEQEQSERSDVRVPPSPIPEPVEEKNAPAVVEAAGARDLFGEAWDAFPRNPASVETLAESAFRKLKPADQARCADAAKRYRLWFEADNRERDRTDAAGARFAPFMAKWIESGAWKQAETMLIPGQPTAAQAAALDAVEYVDRISEAALFAACERIRAKAAPDSIQNFAFRKEVVAQARKELAH